LVGNSGSGGILLDEVSFNREPINSSIKGNAERKRKRIDHINQI
jgi:hypothetical protein